MEQEKNRNDDNNSESRNNKQVTSPPTKQLRHLHKYGKYSSIYTNPVALWLEKWNSRVISIIILSLLFIITLILLPFLMLIGGMVDISRYNKVKGFVICRVITFFLTYFATSLLGIIGFFFIYLFSLLTSPSLETWIRWNYKYQTIWGRDLFFKGCMYALGLKVQVEFPIEGIGEGPKIVFMRHASFADTLLPHGILSGEYQMRYIVKKELTWDPALNVAGFRTPNFFLYREAGQGGIDVEIEAMRDLVRDFTPNLPATVTIWPEGTRFSNKKRERILESLKKKDKEAYEIASQLKYTLLPRLGGALALLDSNPCADVLFCMHVGLEAAADLKEVLSGKLCNSPVQVKFIRVQFKDIPKTKEERVQWMYRHWQVIDKWVDEQKVDNQHKKRD